jgi:hypothetical protein
MKLNTIKIVKKLQVKERNIMKKIIDSLSISEVIQLVTTFATKTCGDLPLLRSLQAKRLLNKSGMVTKRGHRLATGLWQGKI